MNKKNTNKVNLNFINKLLNLAKNEITPSHEAYNYTQDNLLPKVYMLKKQGGDNLAIEYLTKECIKLHLVINELNKQKEDILLELENNEH